jgi:signal transduction histidine kinase
LAAYFVVSESLANAVKHARARRAGVSIRNLGDTVEVEVNDDGQGGATMAGGSGLMGLRDRVEAIDGTLTVDSPPGQGTRITAVLPAR